MKLHWDSDHHPTAGTGPRPIGRTQHVLTCPGHRNEPRWRPGERFQDLFEARCDEMAARGRRAVPAVETAATSLGHLELDAAANRLARFLVTRGARPGDRVALLLNDAVPSYVAMLAVLKVHAAYVPLDQGFPRDRLAFIVQDCGARLVLSLSGLSPHWEGLPVPVLCLDQVEAEVAALPGDRLTDSERGAPVDELAYVIYTSGTTGRPKGVAVEHASICNFVRVAAEVYGIREGDRVYQGMTIAFDFSVEEIWVPLLCGATLVPRPAGPPLLGADLADFLRGRRVTALCCVPTLLATLEEDLPDLRFLLVSGEACPQDLVRRWHRPGRRFLNVYGPTEATVTATWSVVHPERPVTLGVPLPTYSTVILDPDSPAALPHGRLGEIGIAGPGLARGYVNRDDLTERAFVPDFLGIPRNPTSRIYRTGDLGRVNTDGDIEYHGRIDTQVKIRGYRIELGEVESVLLQEPAVAQAAVTTHASAPGALDLVAYYTLRRDAAPVDATALHERLRTALPSYMVPAHLERLERMPMLPSDKVDRRSLPPPTGPRLGGTTADHVAPASHTEQVLAEALAGVLGLDRVSVDSNFFEDLGASSLLLSRFCARVRSHPGLPALSMREVYQHPTIATLAARLADEPTATDAVLLSTSDTEPPGAGRWQYWLCGALQVLLFLAYTLLASAILTQVYRGVSAGNGIFDTYRRALLLAVATFVLLSALPILTKWVLVRRWKAERIPVWSLRYVRFWFVRALVRTNPMVLFIGSPLYVLYLRALGARIGPGVTILSRTVPVCTDLISVGAGTVIRKDCRISGYRATGGVIETGPTWLGGGVLVGEATVLDIDTGMGDHTQLGHSSSLHAGQVVPPGQHWHGSPARPTPVEYGGVPPACCGTVRRFCFGGLQLVATLGIGLPVAVAAATSTVEWFLRSPWHAQRGWPVFAGLLLVDTVAFFGGLLALIVASLTLPRLLNRALRPGQVYPLYGIHHGIQRVIARMTNIGVVMYLFGDSSSIAHYLRWLGYRMPQLEQSGSNFGVETKHESPYLCTVGRGTMVSDGLSLMNAEYSATSFRLVPVSVGRRNFLGNNIAFPPHARTGDNVLLGTKVMVPLDGEVRQNVGLLGSPCFEIPRSVDRDSAFDGLKTPDQRRDRLRLKNRHNLWTALLFLAVRWFDLVVVTAMAWAVARVFARYGAWALSAWSIAALLFSILYFVAVERCATLCRPLRPRFCSIYERPFWRHERFWKLCAPTGVEVLLNGTPLKNTLWRMCGVQMLGGRVFDDGCAMTERTLVTLGRDCTLNAGSTIQCHSLEDATFKSDGIVIGAGCTVGTNGFVHYGVTMGEGSALATDSFLMKGSEVRPRSRWAGNPAAETPTADRSGQAAPSDAREAGTARPG